MRERPILFSGDMVRAILEGRKTVTRRLVPAWQLPKETSQDEGDRFRWMSVVQRDSRWGFGVFGHTEAKCMARYNEDGSRCCPFGNDGDRLWVREAWATDAQVDAIAPRDLSQGEPIYYPADGIVRASGSHMISRGKTRPSIHMPRWASRILLEVTAVRVERLQDITEEQAKADGADPIECKFPLGKDEIELLDLPLTDEANPYRNGFALLWEELGGDWDANPWVWVIEFKRVEAPHA